MFVLQLLKTNVSSTLRLALVLLSLTIGLVSFFAYKSYQDARSTYTIQAKEKLEIAARLLKPYHDEWHDRFLGAEKPTEAEYQALLLKQSNLAKEIGVEYIYSFIYNDSLNFYFSSDSATEEDLKVRDLHTHMREPYRDISPYLIKTVKTKKPQFGEATDQWGTHFSYLAPYTSPHGMHYVLGVDISVNTIQDDARKIFWYWLLIGSFVSTVGFIFAFLTIKPIMKQLNEKNRTLEIQAANLKEANDLLEFLATKDPLTGINNRREFFRLAEKVWNMNDEVYCVMLDLDLFKSINDQYGHRSGDIALVEFTNHVSPHLDEKAIFGRVGGEEFVVIFVDQSFEQVYKTVESIRKSIENLSILVDEKRIRFTVSIGIAKKEAHDSIDFCLDQADQMLYKAKEEGRNKIKFREVKP